MNFEYWNHFKRAIKICRCLESKH